MLSSNQRRRHKRNQIRKDRASARRAKYKSDKQTKIDNLDSDTFDGGVYKPQPYQEQILQACSAKERMLKELLMYEPFIILDELIKEKSWIGWLIS
mgnify:CR=1 FL=1|tara:strand:+ start:78 stop:365 length:288 start_codon:yes stop_codon:yes gene_type:complete